MSNKNKQSFYLSVHDFKTKKYTFIRFSSTAMIEEDKSRGDNEELFYFIENAIQYLKSEKEKLFVKK